MFPAQQKITSNNCHVFHAQQVLTSHKIHQISGQIEIDGLLKDNMFNMKIIWSATLQAIKQGNWHTFKTAAVRRRRRRRLLLTQKLFREKWRLLPTPSFN